MTSPIMPPGYSIPQMCRRLEEKLRKERADELAKVSVTDRQRIEKEIRSDVEEQIKKQFPWKYFAAPVQW